MKTKRVCPRNQVKKSVSERRELAHVSHVSKMGIENHHWI